jgi:hypothetical protein
MPIIKLVVRHPVPSLNKLFAMNPWQRRREKRDTQIEFVSVLLASELGSATLTTFAQNTSWTALGTRALSGMIDRKTSSSKSDKSK